MNEIGTQLMNLLVQTLNANIGNKLTPELATGIAMAVNQGAHQLLPAAQVEEEAQAEASE